MLEDLNPNVSNYAIEMIAKMIERGEMSGSHEILDDETGEYVPLEWELVINC